MLRRGLRDQDVDLALNRVQGYRKVRGVWGEYRNGRSGVQSIDGGFVCVWVGLIVRWV